MTKLDAVLIAGPTASGKSALAVRIAEEADGVVINADSMQVYADLRILTARPSDAELAQAPHELYGFADGAEAYSAGRYAADAARVLDRVRQAGKLPVFAGGTGLYFKVLLEGLSPVPAIPADVREHWRAEAGRLGAAALHETLKTRDPLMAARLVPSDPQRIVRALEVLEATGRSLAEWQKEPGQPVLTGENTARIVVNRPREKIYARCDARLDAMLEGGALDEVAALVSRALSPELPVMRAVGVPPLAAYLRGQMDRDAAVARAKLETRHYVKRQLTWLKRHMMSWDECIEQENVKIARLLERFVR